MKTKIGNATVYFSDLKEGQWSETGTLYSREGGFVLDHPDGSSRVFPLPGRSAEIFLPKNGVLDLAHPDLVVPDPVDYRLALRSIFEEATG